MKNLTKQLAKQYPYKKSNVMGAIEIQGGYMVWIRDIDTKMYRFYNSGEEYEKMKEESENFSLDDFISYNTDSMKFYVDSIDEEIENLENGNPSERYFRFERNRFTNYFDKDCYVLVYHDDAKQNSVTLDEMKKVREFFLFCIEAMTKRCTTWWKKYGASKLKWVFQEKMWK